MFCLFINDSGEGDPGIHTMAGDPVTPASTPDLHLPTISDIAVCHSVVHGK